MFYLQVASDGKITGVDSNSFPGSTAVESGLGFALVDPIRPYYLIDGEITRPPEVITFDKIRGERNLLLSNSDWRATIDYPGTDQQQWLDYRQKLRDIPQDYTRVEDVVFPTEP